MPLKIPFRNGKSSREKPKAEKNASAASARVGQADATGTVSETRGGELLRPPVAPLTRLIPPTGRMTNFTFHKSVYGSYRQVSGNVSRLADFSAPGKAAFPRQSFCRPGLPLKMGAR